MLINWLQRHPRLTDLALLLAAAATAVGGAFHHDRRALGVPLALLACGPLLLRRQHPLPVLALTTAATIAVVAGWPEYNPLPVGIALYTVAAHVERRLSLAAGAVTMLALVVPLGVAYPAPFPVLGRLLGFGVAWLVGDSLRTRRRYVEALEERAERLERERAAEAARAVAEEQARIARELHDIIAHNVSVMVVQAAAARDVFDARPERVRDALRAIEHAGRGALDELRLLLGGVRGDEAEYRPQPGIRDLDELFAQIRTAGLDVAVTIEGAPFALPPAVDLSVYRVIQEALTNTLKHARAEHADVRVQFRDGALDVLVHDDGVGESAEASVNGSGQGLIGMRERVVLLGGSLAAGPADGGGYTVAARFPLGAAA
jgi:signal transduction histidine kinase